MQPSLDFWRDLENKCLENKIGVELEKNVRPKQNSKIPIYLPDEKITVKHHDRMWDPSKKKGKVKHRHQKQRCKNYSNSLKITGSIVRVIRVYYCAMDDL